MISYLERVDPCMQRVIDEMVELISGKYPETTCVLESGSEWGQVFLYAEVDVDDPDEVVDLFIDRLVTIHVDEGIQLHFLPRRTPEREAALRALQDLDRRRFA